ncbi:MAG: hypothetical protein A2W91_11515 [Bacteroidetes bacterium GWF2_38_335]|nr:MAG: hypothetical protein A2W91_11515 [Bacteroidetes bacterium GWF2_38_335]OFY77908.1 MAG: hypothetical protein A2281_18260 [Bacteroidetes bacterium RIFOXYA12_FULL_38_20]HBS86647.1 hypothetical protein [Bacteroidales bacterium]
MKKLVLLLALPFIFFSCSEEKKSDEKKDEKKTENAQVINKEQKGNLYSGKVVILYKNGNIKYVENYKNGIKEGDYMNYYKTGTKKAVGEYRDGIRIGTWVWYDERGDINYAINYDELTA